MNKVFFLLLVSVVFISCAERKNIPTTDLQMASPESIISDGEFLYVSNVGKELQPMTRDYDGYILKCDLQGNPIEIFSGDSNLHAPKGLEIINQTLYVTDIDRVVGYNLSTGEKSIEIDLSSTGGLFFNDLEAYHENLLVSCTDLNQVFVIDLSNQAFSAIPTVGEIKGPNGLHFDETSNTVYVAEWGTGTPDGRIVKLDLSDSSIHVIHDFQGNLDGIYVENEILYVSDWASRGIHQYNLNTTVLTQLKIDSIQGPADFYFNPTNQSFWVPGMMGNSLINKKL